jgi:hypothetical protein
MITTPSGGRTTPPPAPSPAKGTPKIAFQGTDDLGVSTDVQGQEGAARVEPGRCHPAHRRHADGSSIDRDLRRILFQCSYRIVGEDSHVLTVDGHDVSSWEEEGLLQRLALVRGVYAELDQLFYQGVDRGDGCSRIRFAWGNGGCVAIGTARVASIARGRPSLTGSADAVGE